MEPNSLTAKLRESSLPLSSRHPGSAELDDIMDDVDERYPHVKRSIVDALNPKEEEDERDLRWAQILTLIFAVALTTWILLTILTS